MQKLVLGFLVIVSVLIAWPLAEEWWLNHKPLHKGFNLVSKHSPTIGHIPYRLQDGNILFISGYKPLERKPILYDPDTRLYTAVKKNLDIASAKALENGHFLINNYEIIDPYKPISQPIGASNIGFLYEELIKEKLHEPGMIIPAPILTQSGNLLILKDDGLYIFNLALQKIIKKSELSSYKYVYWCTLEDGSVLLGNVEDKRTILLIDPENARIQWQGQTLFQRHFPELIPLADGKILISSEKTVEMFDSKNKKFIFIGKMLEERYGHIAILLKNNKALFSGGLRASKSNEKTTIASMGNVFLKSSELLDLESKKFIKYKDMHVSRSVGNAILLPSGNVLIDGGEYAPEWSWNDFPLNNPTTEIFVPN